MSNKIKNKEGNSVSKTWILTIGITLNEEVEQEDAEKIVNEALENLYECGDDIRLVEKLSIKKGNIHFAIAEE